MKSDDVMRLIGLRVRSLREARRMTQADLASPLGMDPNYLGQIEAGKKNVTAKTLRKITDGLGVTLSAFFDDDLFREMGAYADRFLRREPLPVASFLPSHMRTIDKNVLAVIMDDPNVTIPAIARDVGTSGPTVSRAIRRLKDDGYLERVGTQRGGHWIVRMHGS